MVDSTHRTGDPLLQHLAETLAAEPRARGAADTPRAGVWAWDLASGRVYWSPDYTQSLTFTDAQNVGRFEDVLQYLHADDAAAVRAHLDEALRGDGTFEFDFRAGRDGRVRWLNTRGAVILDAAGTPQRVVGLVADISARKDEEDWLRKRELWRAGQTQALRAALDGAPLEQSLGALVQTAASALGPDVRAAFHLTDEAATGLHHVTGMPAEYAAAVDGFAIGPESLSCGLAAHTGAPVLTPDVLTEPRWEAWRGLAARFGFRGCWSFPVSTTAKEFLGTLALYWRSPRHATDRDLELATLLTDTAAIIISRRRESAARQAAEAALRQSEQRYRRLYDSMRDAVVVVDLTGRILEYNAAFRELLGYSDAELRQLTSAAITPERWHAMEARIVAEQILPLGSSGTYAKEYRRKDGATVPVELRTSLIRDEAGQPLQMWAIVRDITQRARAEAALRESEARFRAFVTASADVVYRMNADWTEMLRLEGREFIADTEQPSGTWLERYIHPDDHALVLAAVRDALATSSPFELEHRVRRASGRLGWTRSRAIPVRDERGAIVEWFGTARDITARKEAEEKLRVTSDSLRQLVERSPFGVYAVDADFRLAMVSAGAQKVFASVQPLIGRHFDEVLRILWPEPFASEALGHFRHTLATGEPYHAPSTIEQRADIQATETYDWKLDRVTLPDGRHGVVCHFYDLSERQRYESALREADRQKDRFLAILAHELRNPLAPIRTSAALMKTRPITDPLVVRSRDVIDRQVTQMSRLLDDLLDVSRLSRGTLTLQRSHARLGDVLGAAIETAMPLVEQRTQSLVVTGLADTFALDGDPARLTQIFGNLLTNAAKYSPPHATITVAVHVEGATAVVAVRDTGAGLAAEHLDAVFELFSQVDATDQASGGGLGIGLALVKHLVELHGGSITAESDGPGRGSTFTVRLPAVRTNEETAEADGTAAFAGAASRKVLIADDNTDAADTLALLVRELGCEVRTVYDGHSALSEAETFRPDVAFLDLGLPDLDGREVCRRIRAHPAGKTVVLVALTGWGRDEDRRRTSLAGFDHHVVKPANPGVLVQLITDLPRDVRP